MKLVIELCLAVALLLLRESFASSLAEIERVEPGRFSELWRLWQSEHDSWSRSIEADVKRYQHFERNLRDVKEHNKRFSTGHESFTLHVNKYADVSFERFSLLMLGSYIPTTTTDGHLQRVTIASLGGDPPAGVDWRFTGWVTSVKDQRYFPNGFAFAAVGALEALYYNITGHPLSLSAQEMVDCNRGDALPMKSARHGLMFAYNLGIKAEFNYPYAGPKQKCLFRGKFAVLKPRSVKLIAKGDVENLKRAVAFVGPVSADIHVNNKFRFYDFGVFKDESCSDENMNHAVLVVGYGSDEEYGGYWIVKNSWGVDWGENGYMRITMNSSQNCRLDDYPSFPTMTSFHGFTAKADRDMSTYHNFIRL